MKIEFYETKKTSKKVNRLLTEICIKNTPLGYFNQYSALIGFFLVGISLIVLLPSSVKVYETFPFYIVCLIVLISGVCIRVISWWYVKKKLLEKSGLLRSKITYETKEDKIIQSNNGGLKLEINQNDILRFIDYKDYLFIFVRENLAYYIPPSAFSDAEIKNEFKREIENIVATANKTL